mmetsp:Transcript_27371/g.43257  ORF Transcript_27371/g.43257 Transcript_27371/m.43257 type:complete len:295 (-) Transcript_27371:17-901(-)
MLNPQYTIPYHILSLLPGGIVILQEPIHRLLHPLIHGGKFVIRPQTSQFFITCRLLELSIGFLRVEHHLSLELHGLGHGVRHVLDGHLRRLVDAERDGIRRVVVTHDPHGELRQIERVNELPQGRAAAPNGEGRVVLLGDVAFVDESRDDVSVLDVEVVVGAVDVCGYDGGEVAAVLLGVGPVHGVDESFGVGVSLVTGVGRSVVEHGLVDGVFGFVGEDACGEHAHEFGHLVDAAVFHDVVVDQSVFSVEFDLLLHISKQSTNLGRQVNNMRRLKLIENGIRRRPISQIAVFR